MASHRITRADLYPDGTTVTAYPAANWSQAARPPSGAPVGSSEGTAGVMASGAATLTNLTDGRDFFAYGLVGGEHRYVGFRTGLSPVAAGVTLAELKRAAQLPAGVIDETMEREFAVGGLAITSGTLYLCGLTYLRAGQPITSLGIQTGTTLITAPTNQWMCLVKQSDLSVLAKTQDKTNEAWAASTSKTFTVTGGPYLAPADTLAYIGFVLTHSPATGTIWSSAGSNVTVTGIAPIKSGTSTTGLTDPASLGATAGAVTALAQRLRAWTV